MATFTAKSWFRSGKRHTSKVAAGWELPRSLFCIKTMYANKMESTSQHNINHLISLAAIIIKQANASLIDFKMLLEETNKQTNLISTIKDQNEFK